MNSAANHTVLKPLLHPGPMLPQLSLRRHLLLLLHHLLLPVSLPLRLPLPRHPRGLIAALAEGGSGFWMRRLVSAAAPSALRAAAGRTGGSTLNAAGQSTHGRYSKDVLVFWEQLYLIWQVWLIM